MKPGQDERVNVAVKKLVKYSNLTIPDATKLADFTPDECATKGLAERVRRRGPSKKEWRKALSAPVMVSSGATESDISSLTTSPQKNGPTKPPSEADRKRMTSSQLQEDRIHKAKMKKHNKASHKRCSGRLRWASAMDVCGGRWRWASAVGVGSGHSSALIHRWGACSSRRDSPPGCGQAGESAGARWGVPCSCLSPGAA